MLNEIAVNRAASILKTLSYIKLDLSTFLIITKKASDPISRVAQVEEYGDSVYLPSPEGLLPALSQHSEFLKYRTDRKNELLMDDAILLNKKCTIDFVFSLLGRIGLDAEIDEKMNIYISRKSISRLRFSDDAMVKDLYSYITRSGASTKRDSGSTWG